MPEGRNQSLPFEWITMILKCELLPFRRSLSLSHHPISQDWTVPSASLGGGKMADNTSSYINYYIKSKCLVEPLTHDEWAASKKQNKKKHLSWLTDSYALVKSGDSLRRQTVRCDSSEPETPFHSVRPLFALFKCAQIAHGGQTAMQKIAKRISIDGMAACLSQRIEVLSFRSSAEPSRTFSVNQILCI